MSISFYIGLVKIKHKHKRAKPTLVNIWDYLMKKDYVFSFLRRLHERSIVFLKGVGKYGGKGGGL